MTTSIEKYKDKHYLFALIAFVFLGTFCILAIPTTVTMWLEGSIDWYMVTWIFGGWFKYNRFDPDLNTSGLLAEDSNFSFAISIIAFIGIVTIIVAIFFTGRNKRRSFAIQRIGGIFMGLGSVLGFVATMLFYNYTQIQTIHHSMNLSAGFYIAAVYFGLMILASLKAIFISVQLPKLVQDKEAPQQEGELIPEAPKLAKKKRLFDYMKQLETQRDM